MFNTINNTIIQTLGISELPLETQQEAMRFFGSLIYQEIILRSVEDMSDDDKTEFTKLIETNPTQETLFDFLASKTPHIETIAKEEAQSIREEDEALMGQIGK